MGSPDGAAAATSVIRLAAVHPLEVVRVGVAALVAGTDPKVRLVAGAADTVGLLDLGLAFDVVLLDVAVPVLTDPVAAVAAVVRLRTTGAAVLVYTDRVGDRRVRAATTAGAVGIVLSNAGGPELVRAVRAAVGTATGCPPAVPAVTTGERAAAHLSVREGEALVLYAGGLPLKSVARQMNVGSATAKEYLTRVRAKYAAAGRPANTKIELHRRAVEDGLLS